MSLFLRSRTLASSVRVRSQCNNLSSPAFFVHRTTPLFAAPRMRTALAFSTDAKKAKAESPASPETPETPEPTAKPLGPGHPLYVDEGTPFKWRDWFTPSGLKKQWTENRDSAIAYAKVGGVGVAVYLVLKAGFNIGDFFASTSFYDVAYVSFGAGCVSSGIIAVIVSYASRMFVIRPELVYKRLLRRLQSDAVVREKLGRNITAGQFRAYNMSSGGFHLISEEGKSVGDYEGWERFWRPKKLQMMFQLEGSDDKGMVSFEAQKEFSGNLIFNSVVLNVNNSGERVVLEGHENLTIYQGKVVLR